ncbi:MAG: hypothetical protein LBB74_05195 [Chitinispirillales bacterium]|jgi:hypothetical protein|nr:hypothetical protein [Chitinispirillales bacterium]
MGVKKIFTKCVAAGLILNLAFGSGSVIFAQDEDIWNDFDATAAPPPPPAPAPSYGTPSYGTPDYSQPSYGTPSYDTPSYDTPSYGAESYDYAPDQAPLGELEPIDESAFEQGKVVAESEGFIKVIRNKRKELSDFPDAVIEGLQVSVDKGTVQDEIIVTCYFIFRDRPSNFFYNIDRKENRLNFEFVDALTGTSPIAALEQAPIREIVIEEDQTDVNKSVKGLNPEWHDVIRISFELEQLPVISVTNEQNIISFNYKWTTNSEKIPQYLYKDKFPLLFWGSAGVLGGIGLGILTYFLTKKEPPPEDHVLPTSDLPSHPAIRNN